MDRRKLRTLVATVFLALVGAQVGVLLWVESHRGDPWFARRAELERLLPVADGDPAWLGTHRMFASDEVELLPGGHFPERFHRHPRDAAVTQHEGAWTRDGTTLRLRADIPDAPERELRIGTLDGALVLLTPDSTWRRVP